VHREGLAQRKVAFSCFAQPAQRQSQHSCVQQGLYVDDGTGRETWQRTHELAGIEVADGRLPTVFGDLEGTDQAALDHAVGPAFGRVLGDGARRVHLPPCPRDLWLAKQGEEINLCPPLGNGRHGGDYARGPRLCWAATVIDIRERVLAAVSGGPDSTALLLMLRDQGADVVAAHYDHALQPASAGMARHVERLCAELGVELITERRTEPLSKGSVQAAARALRYDFLERAASRCGAAHVALGHTADDVVEGVVLHLLRGSGIAGMRGMPAQRGMFIRPLLDTWRVEIEAYLRDRGVAVLHDPANANRRFARVRVRLDLLPVLERDRPGITRRLHGAARRAAELQDRVDGAVATAVDEEPVAAERMRLLYAQAGGAQPGLSRKHIEAMLAGKRVDLPGGLRFRVVGSRAEVVPRVPPSMEATLETRPCAGCAEPGAAHLRPGHDLRIGFRRPGMRIHLRRGTRKLQDVFVDARVPREERDSWPLVFSGDRLAWVPGVAVDDQLEAISGEPSIHVTVNRMLTGSQKSQC